MKSIFDMILGLILEQKTGNMPFSSLILSIIGGNKRAMLPWELEQGFHRALNSFIVVLDHIKSI